MRRWNLMKWAVPIAFSSAIILLCGSCAVGPDYRRPDVTNLAPMDWHWKLAEPKDVVPKGAWWKVYEDSILDDLETEAVSNNQALRAAVARVDQARSAARLSRSRFFPELSLDPSFNGQRTSPNAPTPIPLKLPPSYLETYSVPFDLSYELDLWGRVRRSFEAARAEAQAGVADYENVLLTLTADVAVNYFLLRSLDTEIAALQQMVRQQKESVHLLKERLGVGAISESDAARAATELAGIRGDLADVMRQRAETSHAVALLCGKPASSFEIAERAEVRQPVAIPAGLPSSVLERRPDIAHAERLLAARNARIGVARAAYFPALRLTGQGGYLSAEASSLFSWESRVWSIGPGVSLPLFNAGRTAAEVHRAEAAYDEALADYRQTVLVAFKEVEDSLAQLNFLGKQAEAQADAVVLAKRVLELTKVRYEAGAISYLEVVDADRALLQQERQDAQLLGRRFAATIRLIKALGGGWSEAVK